MRLPVSFICSWLPAARSSPKSIAGNNQSSCVSGKKPFWGEASPRHTQNRFWHLSKEVDGAWEWPQKATNRSLGEILKTPV